VGRREGNGTAQISPSLRVRPEEVPVGRREGNDTEKISPSPRLRGEGRGEGITMESLAKKLRKSSTDAELRLWLHLKNRSLGGFKFRRQHPMSPYVVDFVCLEQKLIIELDGGQHAEQVARDAERTAFLEAKGYRLIRFWNDDVLKQTDIVLEEILRQLLAAHPGPRTT
jgi:very-short-patch-repair endonuclease